MWRRSSGFSAHAWISWSATSTITKNSLYAYSDPKPTFLIFDRSLWLLMTIINFIFSCYIQLPNKGTHKNTNIIKHNQLPSVSIFYYVNFFFSTAHSKSATWFCPSSSSSSSSFTSSPWLSFTSSSSSSFQLFFLVSVLKQATSFRFDTFVVTSFFPARHLPSLLSVCHFRLS